MSHSSVADRSWVDLVDVPASARVLLVDGARGGAAEALRGRAADVTVVAAAGAGTLPPDVGWDLVCLDRAEVRSLTPGFWQAVRESGALVVVVGDTATSPIRVLDRLTRRDVTPRGARAARGRARVRRELAGTGLPVRQAFGLIRSADAPAVAFDALAPSSLPAVLGATRGHVGGWRAAALSAASRLPAERALRVCPGWLVVAGGTGELDPHRVVGKVSNRDSEEIKLLRGDPVTSIERRHLVGRTGGEVSALRELEAVGFDRSPRVVAEPTPYESRCTYMSGSTLSLERLRDDELVAWVGRAAAVLGEIQERTRHDDGTVLIHGDYWLGNLLISGDDVTGVVDWTEAARGSDAVDREFLVSSLDRYVTTDALRGRLERARDSALTSAS
ncbi:phosphotransferase [Nocardioides sp.]|uniref:phosphotransferase n=1 Tax=Nocardioides sp. TaxID=35761 RepID=UPI002B270C7D|nr:phosphotransferase [Nocardioides sp.]